MSSSAARPRVSKATAMGSSVSLRVEDTIEHQPHVPNPELVQFAARALGLGERWRIGTRHQDERRLLPHRATPRARRHRAIAAP